MNTIKLFTKNHSWSTSVNSDCTIEDHKNYFLGTSFNIASYPKEEFERVEKFIYFDFCSSNYYDMLEGKNMHHGFWKINRDKKEIITYTEGDLITSCYLYAADFLNGVKEHQKFYNENY